MKKINIKTFKEAVDYLYATPRFTGKNSCEDTRAFLEKIGSPDKNMKIIHIAGTNGKGSVCSYINSILMSAGYTTAMFTSPHLVDIRERFVINGKIISREEFLWAFLEIYNMLDWDMLADNKGYHPSFFEYIFFIGMLVFDKHRPDVVILETGLGGRLDATNSVSNKEISVITHISLDHVKYLGDTVEKIAAEKAGIIFENKPVVFWKTDRQVSEVIENRAKDLKSPMRGLSKEDLINLENKHKSIDFSLNTRYYGCINLTLETKALYQVENAALAVWTIDELDKGRIISKNQIIQGIRLSHWAGRMDEIAADVFVDGAHNEDGIRAFLETVANDGFAGKRQLLFGVMKDKDYETMIREICLSGLFGEISITKPKGERALELCTVRSLFTKESADCKEDIVIETFEDTDRALDKLLPIKTNNRLYIAGSLYLVGEVFDKLKKQVL